MPLPSVNPTATKAGKDFEYHNILMANFFAQTESLWEGTLKEG